MIIHNINELEKVLDTNSNILVARNENIVIEFTPEVGIINDISCRKLIIKTGVEEGASVYTRIDCNGITNFDSEIIGNEMTT